MFAGVAGTVAMTLLTMIARRMGVPAINPAQTLAGYMHTPIEAGWVAHVT